MLQQLFAVYDKKAQLYAKPFAMQNKAVALRAFGNACADPSTELFKHPADFCLHLVGTFDDETGEVLTLHSENIGEALTLATDPSNEERN